MHRALALGLFVGASLWAQPATIPFIPVPLALDSGSQAHLGPDPQVVWTDTAVAVGASSLILFFEVAELGSDEDRLILTSMLDGEVQILDRFGLKAWGGRSAHFNGGAVIVALELAPGSRGRIVISHALGGAIPDGVESVCGNDDRVLSTEARVCRLITPMGGGGIAICTGWLISSTSTILSAGHCAFANGGVTTGTTAEFNVPASTASGQLVAPPVADQYPMDQSSLSFQDTGLGNDWAVVRLHPNSSGQTAFSRQGGSFTLATSLPSFVPGFGPTVRVTGFGTDTTPNATRNNANQTATDPLAFIVGDILGHTVDTEGGNSGGPIILTSSGQAIGIHTSGGCDVPFGTNAGTSILNSALQTAITNTIGCAAVGLSDGLMTSITCTDTIIDFAPAPEEWNVVGVASTSDWDIRVDGTSSAAAGSVTDFLLANGTLVGSLTPRSGRLNRFSGSASARATLSVAQNLSIGTPATFTWTSVHVLKAYQILLSAGATVDLGVFGAAGLSWRLYPPGSSVAWRPRSSSTTATGTVGGAPVTFTVPTSGTYCLVVFKDGGVGSVTPTQVTVLAALNATAVTMTSGVTTTLTSSTSRLSISPASGSWNLVGTSSASDWNVYLGSGQSDQTGTLADFVLANGNFAVPSPAVGLARRVSGTDAAAAQHLVATSVTIGGQFDTTLASGDAFRLFEFNVTTAGNHSILVSGGLGAGLLWRLYAPGSDASWIRRTDSIASGNVSSTGATSVTLGTGWHALVVYRNGGGLASGTSIGVNVCAAPTTLNLLSSGSIATTTGSCHPVSFTPVSGRWNAIGLASASNWDLAIGNYESELGGSFELLIADARAGTLPGSALVVRESGSDAATVMHGTLITLGLNVTVSTSLPANIVLRVYEVTIASAGSYDLVFTGDAGVAWRRYAPAASTAWMTPGEAQSSGSGNATTTMTLGAGVHAFVILRTVAPGTVENYSLRVEPTPNPVPSLSSLSPSSVVAGTGAFQLSVSGSNFIPGSVVRWNGADLSTQFQSAATLTAQVPAGNVAFAGTAAVTVFNPTPGGGTSSSQTFTILNPTPVVSSLSPSAVTAGASTFTLNLTGTGFVGTSTVRWNGSNLATTFNSATSLSAQVPASLVTTAGTAAVTVFNPPPGGGTSASQTFTINNPVPVLTGMTPTSVTAGSSQFNLALTGSGFTSSSIVRWNGSNLVTTFNSATSLSAQVPASLVATAGTAAVTVFNPSPGGGSSASQTFTINNPVPLILGISPSILVAGSPTTTVIISGSGFVGSSAVRLDGVLLATQLVTSISIQATIPAGMLLAPATRVLSVTNPTPGGGVATGTVVVVGPTITSVSPTLMPVLPPGSAPFPITVTGTRFLTTSVIHANGDPLPTTLSAPGVLTAAIPQTLPQAGLLGAIAIHVANSPAAVSNGVALEVGVDASNEGLIRRNPLDPGPGQSYAAVLEGCPPGAVFSLFIDLENPAPVHPWIDPSMNGVLAVSPLAGSSGAGWFALIDGMGILGPATGTTIGSSGSFVLPGFVVPAPALGVSLTVQAAYFDPTAVYGFRLSFARFPDRL